MDFFWGIHQAVALTDEDTLHKAWDKFEILSEYCQGYMWSTYGTPLTENNLFTVSKNLIFIFVPLVYSQ
jgi:hypothetical protein